MIQRLKLVGEDDRTQLNALSDDDLMRLTALNRRDAFEILVARHQSRIFGLATRFLGDRDKGRDVTQDVFLSLWAERDRFRPKGMFDSYLTSVCLNRCRVVARGMSYQERKTARLEQEHRTRVPDDEALPLSTVLENEQRREIQRHLTKLPEKCRAVMICRYAHDLSLKEISALLEMPLGTVKSHVKRGLISIRRMMNKKGR